MAEKYNRDSSAELWVHLNDINSQTIPRYATHAALKASMPTAESDTYAATPGILWRYDGTLAKWTVANTPNFATVAERDQKVPEEARTPGIRVLIGSGASLTEYTWDGASTSPQWLPAVVDSGWLAITPASSFGGDTGDAVPKAKARGGLGFYRGVIWGSLAANVITHVGTVPEPCRPTFEQQTYRMAVDLANRGTPVFLWLGSDGRIMAQSTTARNVQIGLAALGGSPLS